MKLIFKEVVSAADLQPDEFAEFVSDSLRVGAAEELLRVRFDAAAIMRVGGWRSTKVLERAILRTLNTMYRSRANRQSGFSS